MPNERRSKSEISFRCKPIKDKVELTKVMGAYDLSNGVRNKLNEFLQSHHKKRSDFRINNVRGVSSVKV